MFRFTCVHGCCRVFQTKDLLDSIEAKLTNEPEDLLIEMEAVKNKAQQSREAVRGAREAAEFAVNMTADAGMVNSKLQTRRYLEAFG